MKCPRPGCRSELFLTGDNGRDTEFRCGMEHRFLGSMLNRDFGFDADAESRRLRALSASNAASRAKDDPSCDD